MALDLHGSVARCWVKPPLDLKSSRPQCSHLKLIVLWLQNVKGLTVANSGGAKRDGHAVSLVGDKFGLDGDQNL